MSGWGDIGVRAVDAILLDAAGTIIRPRVAVGVTYSEVASRYGARLDPDQLSQAFAQVFAQMPDLAFDWVSEDELVSRERLWWRDLVGRVLSMTGCRNASFDSMFDALYAYYASGDAWECFSDVSPALKTLRARGFKLAVVSNFDSRLPGILESLGIADLFDAIVYSSRAGSAKPNAGIFRHALARIEVSVQGVLHIGDSIEADVAGAAAAGIRGFHLRRHGTRGDTSDRSLTSLAQLPVWLENHSLWCGGR